MFPPYSASASARSACFVDESTDTEKVWVAPARRCLVPFMLKM